MKPPVSTVDAEAWVSRRLDELEAKVFELSRNTRRHPDLDKRDLHDTRLWDVADGETDVYQQASGEWRRSTGIRLLDNRILLGGAGDPGGTGVGFPYASSDPGAGPAVRWSDGTLTNTIGFYIQAGLIWQGNAQNYDFRVLEPTTNGALGTERARLPGGPSRNGWVAAGNFAFGHSSPVGKVDIRGGSLHVGTNLGRTDPDTGTDGLINCGDTTRDFTPTSANWSGAGTTLLLNALNHSTICFHDAGARVDAIRVGGGIIDIGYDVGWGNPLTLIVGKSQLGGGTARTESDPQVYVNSSGMSLAVNSTAASRIWLATSDPTTGAWLRNDGANFVISTNVGNLYLGFGGNAGKVIHIGNGNPGVVQVTGSANSGSLIVDSASRVGVGTSPSRKFHVAGGASQFETSVYIDHTGITETVNQAWLLADSSGTTGLPRFAIVGPVQTSGHARPVAELSLTSTGSTVACVDIYNDLNDGGGYGSGTKRAMRVRINGGDSGSNIYADCGLQLSTTTLRSSIGLQNSGAAAMIQLNSTSGFRFRNSNDSANVPLEASAFNVVSVRASKRKIRYLADSRESFADRLMKLRPVRYKRLPMPGRDGKPIRQPYSENDVLGLVVEDLMDVLPEAVAWSADEDGNHAPSGIDFAVVTAALVKAVQELAEQAGRKKEAV